METKDLLNFIHEASKATYASGDDSISKKESDESTTITFEQGDWSFHDNFFGGEPYGGREVVFYKGKPVFIMVYYGWVEKEIKNSGEIYKILQEALRNAPAEEPFRGPSEYFRGNFKYTFTLNGNAENFTGEEVIFENDNEIYRAKFIGGLVDMR